MIRLQRAYEPAAAGDGKRAALGARCHESAPEARCVAQGRGAERGLEKMVQARPNEVARVSTTLLHRTPRASRGVGTAAERGQARTGNIRLRRA